MATVKLQGGKVVLKGGRVSCECCEEPEECCAYPARAIENGVYTYEDLPDKLNYEYRPLDISLPTTVFGEFTRLNPPSPALSPTGWVVYYVGQEHTILAAPDDPWTFTPLLCQDNTLWKIEPDRTNLGNTSTTSADCLIGNYPGPNATANIEDQFADTYTVTYSYDANPLGEATFIHSETVTVTRQSLCAWRGTDNCGNPLWLEIVLFDEDKPEETFLSWAISFYMYRTDYSINAMEILCNTGSQYNALKQGFQNTPLGNYKFAFQNLVVS